MAHGYRNRSLSLPGRSGMRLPCLAGSAGAPPTVACDSTEGVGDGGRVKIAPPPRAGGGRGGTPSPSCGRPSTPHKLTVLCVCLLQQIKHLSSLQQACKYCFCSLALESTFSCNLLYELPEQRAKCNLNKGCEHLIIIDNLANAYNNPQLIIQSESIVGQFV